MAGGGGGRLYKGFHYLSFQSLNSETCMLYSSPHFRFIDTSDFRTPEDKVLDLQSYKDELFKLNQYNTYQRYNTYLGTWIRSPHSVSCIVNCTAFSDNASPQLPIICNLLYFCTVQIIIFCKLIKIFLYGCCPILVVQKGTM